MIFQQNLLEKAYFIAKMSGPTLVWPVISDVILESALKATIRINMNPGTYLVGGENSDPASPMVKPPLI